MFLRSLFSNPFSPVTLVIAFLAIVLLLVVIAEIVHLRRCSRLRDFLFHGCRFPWGRLGTLLGLRIVAVALVCIGLAWLWSASTHPAALNSAYDDEETDRLLIVLDCSLSMDLRDAGPRRDISRGERAAQLIQELLVNDRKLPRTTLVVFAEGATPLIIDTNDWNVVRHSLNNRSLSEFLFDDKKTTIGTVLASVCKEFASSWPDRSTTLLLITDGDSEDRANGVELPASIRRALVLGVGSKEGKLIGNFQSRQDEAALQGIAEALGGRYFNGNESSVSSDLLGRPAMTEKPKKETAFPIGQRPVWGLALLGIGSLLLMASTLISPFLNPAKATPLSYEPTKFLS